MPDRSDLIWLLRRTVQQLGHDLLRRLDVPEGRAPLAAATNDWRSELQRFQEELETLGESDLALFGTVLSGLEDTLMSPRDMVYRDVLDHLVVNAGGLLDDLGCFDIFGGQVAGAEVDLSWAPTIRARVTMNVALPLEQTRRLLTNAPVLRPYFEGLMPCLGIHRLFRPRLLRSPEPDIWTYGLFGRDRAVPQDLIYLTLRRLPETLETSQAEIPIVTQRSRLRDIVFSASPSRQEVLPRLTPRDFMALLRGLLYDTRAYAYRRARDQRDLDQLNRTLFKLLARSGSPPQEAPPKEPPAP